MNCFEEIELVIDYIEKNINNVNIADISRLTGIPGGLYQRIFSYVCGVSVAEYVRKRKITEAAGKILHSRGNVIDIAMEYDYGSHSAFTRAFKEQFGVPPTSLTSEIFNAQSYQRFSFHNEDETYYVMKGRRIMADVVKIEYVQMNERMLIGVAKSVTGLSGQALEGVF